MIWDLRVNKFNSLIFFFRFRFERKKKKWETWNETKFKFVIIGCELLNLCLNKLASRLAKKKILKNLWQNWNEKRNFLDEEKIYENEIKIAEENWRDKIFKNFYLDEEIKKHKIIGTKWISKCDVIDIRRNKKNETFGCIPFGTNFLVEKIFFN